MAGDIKLRRNGAGSTNRRPPVPLPFRQRPRPHSPHRGMEP
jgi:hypothetical protein